MKPIKVAVIVSHPIQHFCPMYAQWGAIPEAKLKVFFASKAGMEKYYDEKFKKEIKWGSLRLEDFDHEFLIENPGLDEALKLYNPELLIVYGYVQKIQKRARLWAVKNHKKIFMISDSELRHSRSWYTIFAKFFLMPYILKKFDGFLTIGNANEEYYMHYGIPKEKLFRSPFPIDNLLYSRSLDKKDVLRKEIRDRYNIQKENCVLSVVGKLISIKSQVDIIKALQLLDTPENRIVLFVIGSGEDEQKLRSKAEKLQCNKVIFTGFVYPEELPAFYAATDIYIHPSKVEPHSLAISEAVYSGCPVILSSTCGSYGENDDVQPGQNGFVYQYGDITALAAYIKKLINDPGLREAFSKRSSEIGCKFQVTAHYDGLHRVLKYLAGENE